jgi:hypothetical protein
MLYYFLVFVYFASSGQIVEITLFGKQYLKTYEIR